MSNLTEAVTEVEYNTSLSDENYSVLFGAIAEIGDRIISVMDKRNNTHGNVGIYGGALASWSLWRLLSVSIASATVLGFLNKVFHLVLFG